MKVLLTTIRLVHRGGSEMYVADVARGLRARGHTPVVYAAVLGPPADAIRRAGVPVIDDLAALSEPPDVIHAQHHLATMAALAALPHVPAVYVCHGWLPWEETPPRHPAIRQWVAVSDLTRQRLVSEAGVPPERVHVVPNFVDLTRFGARTAPVADRPRRALVYGNSPPRDGWVETLRHVCAAQGVELDMAGLSAGRPIDDPERRLPAYDLVFARGRCALEAMAVGAGVVLCDVEGLGPMVTTAALPALRAGNFGVAVLREGHSAEGFRRELARWDAAEVARVSATVRATAGLDTALDTLVDLYEQARAEGAPDAPGPALASYLRWLVATMPTPRVEERAAVIAARHAARTDVEHAVGAARDAWTAERSALAHDRDEAVAQAAALAAERDRARDDGTQAQEALARAAAERDRLRAEAARADEERRHLVAERDAAQAALTRITSGVLVRRVAPLVWSTRAALLPEGTRRFRLYERVRGRLARRRRRVAAGGVVVASRPRLLCVVAFHDEARFLPDFLANVAPHVDGIVALDDGSTDESAAIVAAHPAVLELVRLPVRTPHVWDEPRNRRLLLDAVARHGAAWVLALDADERVERTFGVRAAAEIARADRQGHGAFTVILRELWDAPDRYRVDGVWSHKHPPRLFRFREGLSVSSMALHGPWAPDALRAPDGSFPAADVIVYHLRMIAAADREQRRRRYQALDPDRRWQAIGYDYLTDEVGLTLESLPPGRDYEPMPRPGAVRSSLAIAEVPESAAR